MGNKKYITVPYFFKTEKTFDVKIPHSKNIGFDAISHPYYYGTDGFVIDECDFHIVGRDDDGYILIDIEPKPDAVGYVIKIDALLTFEYSVKNEGLCVFKIRSEEI